MALVDDIKTALRIKSTALDTEVNDLIAAAQSDLVLSGILGSKAIDDTDPLIKRALTLYCKANFGFDNPDYERLQTSYETLKSHLSLSVEYTEEAV